MFLFLASDATTPGLFDIDGQNSVLLGAYGGYAPIYGTATDLTSGVPEPSTWAMMLIGFTGLGFAFQQSRRKASMA